MSQFDERGKAFETKFAYEQEREFRAHARRNRLLGEWAAEKLGLTAAAADDYAKAVVKADLADVGDEDVFRKIRQDFDAKGVAISDHQLRREMEALLAVAREQILSETSEEKR